VVNTINLAALTWTASNITQTPPLPNGIKLNSNNSTNGNSVVYNIIIYFGKANTSTILLKNDILTQLSLGPNNKFFA